MRIVFISPNEPFFLPQFYSYLLPKIREVHDVLVAIVPVVYRKQSHASMFLKYLKTFGLWETTYLSFKKLRFSMMNGVDVLLKYKLNRSFSLRAQLEKLNVPYIH
jgi:hypothetical protein